ncbi:hypothetical protein CCACVL1_14648 [Corchorus capsularis]|uniref:Uncharacterized protein n=1 Tax=Corchorus capsularis TaxID=210143 RepID=A0A1R3I6D6_COCAP|nr:hypothetical protein CCACVL1_14648 [Corchorus capsularis]
MFDGQCLCEKASSYFVRKSKNDMNETEMNETVMNETSVQVVHNSQSHEKRKENDTRKEAKSKIDMNEIEMNETSVQVIQNSQSREKRTENNTRKEATTPAPIKEKMKTVIEISGEATGYEHAPMVADVISHATQAQKSNIISPRRPPTVDEKTNAIRLAQEAQALVYGIHEAHTCCR